jgi:NTP pyrophosphatase (non-canonical NTP hydrolase)
MSQSELSDLAQILRDFVRDREWEQFHSPKNLVMALMGEAGELGELFQWLTEDQSRRIMDEPGRGEAVRDELADVLLYVIRIADVLGVDLAAAARAKMTKNAANYPVELARGNARKHTELRGDD